MSTKIVGENNTDRLPETVPISYEIKNNPVEKKDKDSIGYEAIIELYIEGQESPFYSIPLSEFGQKPGFVEPSLGATHSLIDDIFQRFIDENTTEHRRYVVEKLIDGDRLAMPEDEDKVILSYPPFQSIEDEKHKKILETYAQEKIDGVDWRGKTYRFIRDKDLNMVLTTDKSDIRKLMENS